MTYTFIAEHCSDLPISTCCRVMRVSKSGFYQPRREPVTDTELVEAYTANIVRDIWTISRRSYGAPRVRDELRLGMGRRCSKTQAERWMRACGAVGIHYPSKRGKNGCTRRDGSDPNPDLVNRRFDPDGPDRLWVMDVTEHRTGEGKVSEFNWSFGNRLRNAGILRSMGSIGDAYDNSVAEAFFSILQRELLDQHDWDTRDHLAAAIFEWIEAWCNPAAATATTTASAPSTTRPHTQHDHPTPTPSVKPGDFQRPT